jgi:cell division protein FtsI (penicillin-binding protein 3)
MIHSRYRLLWIITLIFFSTVIIKLIFFTTQRKTLPKPPQLPLIERGSIFDRNGFLLAEQIESYDITLWLPDLHNMLAIQPEEKNNKLKQIATELAPLILWPSDQLLDMISQDDGNKNIILLKRASPELCQNIQNLLKTLPIPGLLMVPQASYVYPSGSLAANVLGYVNLDNQGGDGLQYAFERLLSPSGLTASQNRSSGYSLELTIDSGLQELIETRMQQAVQQNKASSAIALVADATTAEILAYVSLPTYDPNYYNLSHTEERLNRPVSITYEPGSVFKVFSLAAMLDSGFVKETDRFLSDVYTIHAPNGETITIRNAENKIYGLLSPEQILASSSNVGMAKMSDLVPSDLLYQYLKKFGFGKKTNIPLAGEAVGVLPPVKNWSLRSKATITFGQEMSVQAMQIIQASTALTNDGQMLKPRLVRRVKSADGTIVKTYEKQVLDSVISPTTAHTMLRLLGISVDTGIAKNMQVSGIEIGGKTGTSQIYNPTTHSYSEVDFLASSLAFVPLKNPQYILYIALFRPMGSSYWGSTTTAPLISKIVAEMTTYFGIPSRYSTKSKPSINPVLPTTSLPTTSPSSLTKALPKTPTQTDAYSRTMPNLIGLSREAAIDYCKKNQLNYRLKGSGQRVVDQFPPAGTLIREQTMLTLELGT